VGHVDVSRDADENSINDGGTRYSFEVIPTFQGELLGSERLTKSVREDPIEIVRILIIPLFIFLL